MMKQTVLAPSGKSESLITERALVAVSKPVRM
jgi:hypothetical protein